MKKQIVALFVLLSGVGVFPVSANDLERMINRSIELIAPVSQDYFDNNYTIIDSRYIPENIKLWNFTKNKAYIVDMFAKRRYKDIVKFEKKHFFLIKYILSEDTLKLKLKSNYINELGLSGDTLVTSSYGDMDYHCFEVIYRFVRCKWVFSGIKTYTEKYISPEANELFIDDCFVKLIEYFISNGHIEDVYFHMSGMPEPNGSQDLVKPLIEKYNIRYFSYKTEENVILKKHRGKRFNVIRLNADITGDKLSIIFNEYESEYRLFRIRRKLVNAYRFVYQYSREKKEWNLIEQPQ